MELLKIIITARFVGFLFLFSIWNSKLIVVVREIPLEIMQKEST